MGLEGRPCSKQQGWWWWCEAVQLRQAGSSVHMEGARRSRGEEAKQGGGDALTLNQPVGEDGRMLRMESRQWMIETQC